jgi:hypothetical protein
MHFLAEPAAAVLYSFFGKGESPQTKIALEDITRPEDFSLLPASCIKGQIFTTTRSSQLLLKIF